VLGALGVGDLGQVIHAGLDARLEVGLDAADLGLGQPGGAYAGGPALDLGRLRVGLGGDAVADDELGVGAVVEVGDAIVEVVAALAGAVGAREEAGGVLDGEGDLEEEVLLGAGDLRHGAAVDDEEGEGAGARGQALAVGGLDLADEPDPRGVR
jgi:hypothetical protein